MITADIWRAHTIDDAIRALLEVPATISSATADRIRSERHLRDSLRDRRRRIEWVWVAARHGELIGRVSAFGHPDHDLPWLLDVIDVPADDPATAIRLLELARRDLHHDGLDPVEITLFAPTDWQTTSPGTHAVLEAATSAGFRLVVERHRFEWEAGLPVLGAPARVRPVEDDEYDLVVDTYRRTMDGTLDVHVRTALADGHTVDEIARSEVDDMRDYNDGDLSGWRFGIDDAGAITGLATVGFEDRTVIGYVGVVPEHRGHGLAAGLLHAATALASQAGVGVIAGETDVTNQPMAAAFRAVGYPETDRRIDLMSRT